MKKASKCCAVEGSRITSIKSTLSVLSLLFGLLVSSSGHAAYNLSFSLVAPFVELEPLVLAAKDRQWLDERQVLRVGVATADYEPIDIASDRNRYQGISADYLSLIGSKLNLKMQVVGFARPDDAIKALRDGAIDIITTANNFQRGDRQLRLSKGYMSDRSVLIGRGSGNELTVGLKGSKVVVLDGYVDPLVLHASYPDSEVIVAPNLFSAMEAVSQGEADALIANEVVARSFMSLRPYLGLQVQSDSALPLDAFAFAVRKEDQRLLSMLDAALSSLDPSVVRDVLGRWTLGLGADVSSRHIGLNRSERDWIGKHPVITVATEQQPPYIYRGGGGEWMGLNVDILNRISRLTGLQFVHVEIQTIEQAYDLLRSGQAQMNTTLAENAERRKFLDFSYSFGGNSWVYVVRSDEASPHSLEELTGRTLALPANHALQEDIRRNYPGIKLRLVENYEEARYLVASGKAVATIQNEAGAHIYPPSKLKVGRSVEGWWSPDRMSVIKAQPELLGIVNKALEEFPVVEMRAIRAKWLSAVAPHPSIWSRIPGWIYWLFSLAVLIGLVSLAWSSCLRVQVLQRLKAVEELNDQLAFKHALLNGIPNPIYVRDLQGRLISCNRSYEDSLGLSFEQMNGRRLIDVELIPPSISEQLHSDYIRLLETREPIFMERSMCLFDKQIDAWQWTVPFYRADGELQGLMGGWVDVTECKQLQAQLQEARQMAEQIRSSHAGSVSQG